MPVFSYFFRVGLALVGLLYVSDAVLPHDTRLQVRSNFEGIPPAPQRQHTRYPLSSYPEYSTSSAEIEPATAPIADNIPALSVVPDSEISTTTSVPAPVIPQLSQPSLLEGEGLDIPFTAIAATPTLQAAAPPRNFQTSSERVAKRRSPYKTRKHAARKRQQREDDFAAADGGTTHWSWRENDHQFARERGWRTKNSPDRVWRDPYWRSEHSLYYSDRHSPGWR
jgi:hypothetical protein